MEREASFFTEGGAGITWDWVTSADPVVATIEEVFEELIACCCCTEWSATPIADKEAAADSVVASGGTAARADVPTKFANDN